MRLLSVCLFILSWQSALGRAIDLDILDLLKSDAGSVPLRILSLGASIVWGEHSSDGNGFRKPLRDQLTSNGWSVDMVGSRKNGNMQDNDVEATPGNTIDQVRAAASNSLQYKPNVVLINAGTNDARLAIDVPNAGNRMRTLIESLTSAPDMRNTLIVLSTLIPSGNTAITRNTPSINTQYRALVETLRKQGTRIVLAEMNSASGTPSLTYPDDYRQNGVLDDTHPGDSGYVKMASIWYEAISSAAAQGLISSPAVAKS
ncbi:SGNH hydrolase-type esterase domain-containing protein [Aspergillus karnatakaensis]|uniref:SGNH/GDSL hydrolase family protein n=1 Tax=Aspergillus karnatakaensis TaxID=1810916 RepID=UPI003CCE3137